MKMHRFEVYVFDTENIGAEQLRIEVERSKYAFITAKFGGTAEIGDFDDDHELNNSDTSPDRFRSYFPAALSQPAAQGDSSHPAGGECGGVQVRAVLLDVEAERHRQDAKWGGPMHDDSHEVSDFVQLIEDYAGWARTMAGMGSYDKARNRLIQVAALASACCESIDRAAPKATP